MFVSVFGGIRCCMCGRVSVVLFVFCGDIMYSVHNNCVCHNYLTFFCVFVFVSAVFDLPFHCFVILHIVDTCLTNHCGCVFDCFGILTCRPLALGYHPMFAMFFSCHFMCF